MQRSTRVIPSSRRFLSVPPTGRPATTDKTTNLGRQTPGGYGGSGGPIPQGTGPAPPQPPKKSNVGFIVGAIALVAGSGAYYLTLDDPKKEVAHDLSALKKGAEHEVDAFRAGGARSTSEQLGPTAGAGAREAARYADNLRSPDQRYGAEQVKDALHRDAHAAENAGRGVADEVKQWGNKLAGDARAATDRAERAGHGFKDEVHRWGDALSSGPRERDAWKPTLDELKRYRDLLRGPDREYGYEQVEKALKGNGVDVTTVGRNPYLDWVGPGHHLRRGTVERKLRDLEREGKSALDNAAESVKDEYERAKSAAANLGHEVKTESWVNWSSSKAEQAKDKTEAELERAKQAASEKASSWSSWSSSKADEAKSSLSSAASQAESTLSSAAQQAESTAQAAARKAEAEGKSWWNWSGDKAADAKDGLKSGLLAAEKGVEHGAQKAQQETKKL
ncbi:hypothetical protein JCM10450v2_002194 [Rhodotorula kratochvilovae]